MIDILKQSFARWEALCALFLKDIILLIIRLRLGWEFFNSGRLKLQSWDITLILFQEEYQVPLLPAELAAYMATAAELTLPILLVLGLFTPLAAAGLFIMALTIELFVYPGTIQHYYWMLFFALLMTQGGGKFSLDKYVLRPKLYPAR